MVKGTIWDYSGQANIKGHEPNMLLKINNP